MERRDGEDGAMKEKGAAREEEWCRRRPKRQRGGRDRWRQTEKDEETEGERQMERNGEG